MKLSSALKESFDELLKQFNIEIQDFKNEAPPALIFVWCILPALIGFTLIIFTPNTILGLVAITSLLIALPWFSFWNRVFRKLKEPQSK